MTKKIIDLKTKIYQMFILGLEGAELAGNPNLINALQNGLGGVIFFTQNIQTTNQFKKLICDIKEQAAIASCDYKTDNYFVSPPFLSIDQEGGRVERTENIHGGKKYLSAKYAAQKGEDFLKEQTKQIAKELKDFGINLNFAPVLDVNTNPNNPIIGERAFSSDSDEVIKFGKIVVGTYLENGITPCAKHFPGHGDASVDSHIELPEINLSLEEMEDKHIKPFEKVDVPMIMVAHLHCLAFDKEKIPSSMSKNVLDYLKNELDYKGLIITDDMIMGGSKHHDDTLAAINAIKAGVDILLYRDSHDTTIQIIENIAKHAQNDSLLFENINASYQKIIEFKARFLN